MNDTLVHEDFATRCQKVLQVAKDLYHGNPDWVTFFREVLGVNGAARNVFASQEEYVNFEKSEEHAQIQQMVASLRGRKIPGNGHNEPTRVITVRLPESLHEALKAEANDHNTSMNKLCISKLLQVLMEEQPTKPMRRTGAPSPTSPTMSSQAPTPNPTSSSFSTRPQPASPMVQNSPSGNSQFGNPRPGQF